MRACTASIVAGSASPDARSVWGATASPASTSVSRAATPPYVNTSQSSSSGREMVARRRYAERGRAVDCVLGLRAVDRDDGKAVAMLDQDGILHSGTPLGGSSISFGTPVSDGDSLPNPAKLVS